MMSSGANGGDTMMGNGRRVDNRIDFSKSRRLLCSTYMILSGHKFILCTERGFKIATCKQQTATKQPSSSLLKYHGRRVRLCRC